MRMINRTVFIIVILTIFLSISCMRNSVDSNDYPVLTSYDWPSSTPSSQGFDETILTNACDLAEGFSFFNAYLIVRNGCLIVEWYHPSYDKDDYHPIFSVTKSLVSALVGIAISENYIDSVNQTLLTYFPEYTDAGLDPRMSDVTIRHLLTMTSGVDGSDYPYYLGTDWIGDTIIQPLAFDPGEDYLYTDYGAHLLSGIITRATGMSTLEFARQYLMGPLGIEIVLWNQDPAGYYLGGSNMMMTPRDLARFGYLFLNNGLADGIRIVSESWVEESLEYHLRPFDDWASTDDIGYGYLWWLGIIGGYRFFSAMGYGGQLVFVIPDLDMVLVTICWSRTTDPQTHIPIILDWIDQYILPAIDE